MKNPVDVSVLIPAYNCVGLLQEAIDSALAQKDVKTEILVIDDGSTDETPEMCLRYGDRIRYIRKENGGTPSARNVELSHSRGKYIALLDQDDLWLPGKLAAQVSVMETDANIGMVHTGGRIADLETGRITSEYSAAPELGLQELLKWCTVSCATAMIRRDALEQLGGFDENLPGADDWDLWIRIARQYRVVGIPEGLTIIREHGNNQGHRYRKMYPIVQRVITKHWRLCQDCAECKASLRWASKRLRCDYYVKACRLSKEQVHQGKFASAVLTRIDALAKYPHAFLHILRRSGRRPQSEGGQSA